MANVHGFRDINNPQQNRGNPIGNMGGHRQMNDGNMELDKVPFINSGHSDRPPLDETIPYTLKIFCCPTIKLLSLTTLILIVIWALYIACCVNGIDTSQNAAGVLAIPPQVMLDFGAAIAWKVKEGQVWRLFTAAFLHWDLLHIIMNSLSLLFFLSRLEDLYAPYWIAAMIFASIITGNLSSMLFNPNTITAGASVFIFGILGAYIGYMVINWEPLARYNALRGQLCCIIGFLVAFSVLFSIGPKTDFVSHIFGLMGGFLATIGLFPSLGEKSKWLTIIGLLVLSGYNLTIALIFFLT